MANEPKLVPVEFIDERLIKTRGTIAINGKVIHGEYHCEEIALRGERQGKWHIVRSLPIPKVYETRMMSADNSLTMTDVFGEYETKKADTKGVKKKKIAWVQDLLMIGGAEISCQETVRIGWNCGFDIRILSQADPVEKIKAVMENSDLAIINNIFAFSEPQMKTILSFIFNEQLPYVKYEHDHRELQRKEFSRPLFQRSKLNVFLSPMHRDNHVKGLDCDGICLPLAIDTKRFYPVHDVSRETNFALVCNVRHFKTWANLQKYITDHPEMRFRIMADQPMVAGDNVKFMRLVPYVDMARLYSEHDVLVHLLDGLGAGERVIFEAALCGCRIVANDGVGHMSWEKDLIDLEGLRAWLDAAPYQFWQEVEAVI